MRKITFLSAVLALAFCLPMVAQKKLAYITEIPISTAADKANDTLFIQAFAAAGFVVDTINAAAALPSMAQYDVLVLSAVPNSGGAGLGELKTVCLTKPFVNLKTYQLQSSRWKWVEPANNSAYSIIIPEAMKNHPLYNGITFTGAGEDELLLSTKTEGNGVVTIKQSQDFALQAATLPTLSYKAGTTDPSYFEIPIGTLISGTYTTHKQVVLGLSETAWNGITPAAVKLAVNAAKYVLTPGNFVKNYQFERWYAADVNNLIADTLLAADTRKWYADPADITEGVIKRFKNNLDNGANATLTANGVTLAATDGILFPSLTKNNLTLRHNYGDNGVQFGSSNKKITVAGLQAGQFVQVTLKSASGSEARGISAVTNLTGDVVGANSYGTPGSVLSYQFEVAATANVDFTYSGGIILKSILVTESPAATVDVAIPVVSIAHNTTTNEKTVTITCATAGAEVYYTTDGTNPTKASTLYSAPFTMTAEQFNVIARAWVGESGSPDYGKGSWSDPLSFDTSAEYYIYSHGANDAGLGVSRLTNGKYLYATSATDLRWQDSLVVVDDANVVIDFTSNVYKWKIEDAGAGFFKFKNAGNNAYIAKGTIAYLLSEAEATIASAVLNPTGDAFFIVEQPKVANNSSSDNARPWTAHHYSIQFSQTDKHGLELNGDVTGNAPTVGLANTIQINNEIADRARFLWIFRKVEGGAGVNNVGTVKTVVKEKYFDVTGREVPAATQGIVIKVTTYTDGSVEGVKVFNSNK